MDKASDQPKYINSPETKVYNKSRVLYGLYQSKQAIRKSEEVILVEGYTDVISLHQAGVKNVVASSGTALTADQVKTLGRYAKRVLLLYDADTAGADAALRGIDLVLAHGYSAYAISLPGGEDPDSYVREHGGEAFREYARKNRQDFVTFIYGLSRRKGRLDTPEGQARTMHEILASVARIPDTLMQETFIRRASEVLDVPDMQLRPVLSTLLREKQQKVRRDEHREQLRATAPTPETPAAASEQAEGGASSQRPTPQPPPDVLPQEHTLLRLMLEQGAPMIEFIRGHMALDEFTEGPSRQIVEILLEMYRTETLNTQRFFDGSYDPAIQRLAAGVLVDRYEPSENWAAKKIHVPRINEDPHRSATSAMTLLKLNRVKEAVRQHKAKMFRATHHGGDLHMLQTQMMHLIKLQKQIESGEFLKWNQDQPDPSSADTGS